jgi:hypothetical protein
MKNRLMAAAFAIVFALVTVVSGRMTASADQSFRLVNDSDTGIYHLYVSRHYDDHWGDDVLGRDVLPSGYFTNIVFPEGTFDTCYWDIMAVFDDGTTGKDIDVNLCEYNIVTFH